MLRFYYRHPILFTLIGSFLMGVAFLLRVEGVSRFPYYLATPLGGILLMLFGAVFMLSLVNVVLLFTRPDNGPRDRTLKILEPIGLVVGCYFFAQILGLRYGSIRRMHDSSDLWSGSLVSVFLIAAFFSYLLLRYAHRYPSRLVKVIAAVAVSVGMGLCGWFFVRMLRKETFFLSLYLGNCLLIGLRVLIDTVIREVREKRADAPTK